MNWRPQIASCLFGLAGVVLVGATEVRAWGDDGHKIVAQIARSLLDPAVRTRVDQLLNADNDALTAKDMVSRALWADRFRDSDRNTTKQRFNATRRWHFVDIELQVPSFDAACFGHPGLPGGLAASVGPAKSCVADKIDQFVAELKNPNTPQPERILALKFVLHFVGDIHQPLHAADNHDSGGNDVGVLFGKRTVFTDENNLHHYWDTVLVDQLGPNPAAIAAALATKFAHKKSEWMKGVPAECAQESFTLAKTVAYKLPTKQVKDKKGKRGFRLGTDYLRKGKDVVSEQLAKAGMRLAMILNDALK